MESLCEKKKSSELIINPEPSGAHQGQAALGAEEAEWKRPSGSGLGPTGSSSMVERAFHLSAGGNREMIQ